MYIYLHGASTPNRSEELIDCIARILNDVAGLQYSYVIFGGDMNFDVAVENDLCSVLHSLACDLDLKFVYDKLPANDRVSE